MQFQYDGRGYLSQRSNYLTGENESFTHDELGRLTHWAGSVGGAWSVHYEYDDIGNMSSQAKAFPDGHILKKTFTSGPNADGAVWGGPHAVTKVHLEDTSANGGGPGPADLYYNYDPLGRQIQAGPSRTLTYTDFDLPQRIVEGGATWDFQYDADHRRSMKTDATGRSTVYVGKLYEKRTAASGDVTHVMYVPGDHGDVVAQVTQAAEGTSPIVDYLHSDQLASVTAITSSSDPAGASVQMRFDPFGGRIGTSAPPGPDANPLPRVTLGFTGQEEDGDGLDLVNLNGRIYDPTLMRFLSPDPFVMRPLNSQEFNRYSYANNSPFRFTDTSGFQDSQISEVTPDVPGGMSRLPEETSQTSSDPVGTQSSTPMQGDPATSGFCGVDSNQTRDDSQSQGGASGSGQGQGGIVGEYDEGEYQALMAQHREANTDPLLAQTAKEGLATESGAEGAGGNPTANDAPKYNGGRFNGDQEAVVDLAKEAQQKGGVTKADAETLVKWGKEVGFGDSRGPEDHGGDLGDHIHVGPVNHIPVVTSIVIVVGATAWWLISNYGWMAAF
jgi:RHS repeat-associated protein